MGFGPVAPSAVRDLIDTGDPFLAAVVTKGTDVVGVAHLGRRLNSHQQTALEWLYPTCAVEGCSTTVRPDFDLGVVGGPLPPDCADSHITVLGLLDRLCSHHHDLKTHQGWSLVPGRGKRRFVGPDDSGHPGGGHHGSLHGLGSGAADGSGPSISTYLSVGGVDVHSLPSLISLGCPSVGGVG